MNAESRQAAIELLRETDEFTVKVASGCMAPVVEAGERVLLRSCRPADLRAGDVVLLRREGRLFLHRYLGPWPTADEAGLLCRPDRGSGADRPWPAGALLGRALAIVRDNADVRELRVGGGQRLWSMWRWLLARAGVLPTPADEDGGEARRERTTAPPGMEAACLGRIWRLSPPTEEAQWERAAVVLRAGGAWREAARADPAAIPIRVYPTAPPARESFSEAGGFASWAGGVAARVDRTLCAAEIYVQAPPLLPAALESLFRLAAVACARATGGVCLHASCAAVGGKLYVFAGPSGRGKTTAARACGAGRMLDDDLVLLRPAACPPAGYARVPWLPRARGADAARDARVRALLLPVHGEDFRLERLPPAEAVRACLHLPAALTGPGGEGIASWLEAVHNLVTAVPVLRLRWRAGQDLAPLLERGLEDEP